MRRKQKIWHRVIISMVMCGMMFLILVFYAKVLQRELNEEIIGMLTEASEQSGVILNGKIEESFMLLEEISARLSAEDEFDREEAMETLKEIAGRHSFRRMGIVMPDGNAYTTDDENVYLGDRDFYKESIEGNRSVSNRLVDKISGGYIIVYSVPVYESNRVCAVLFGTYKVEELQQLLSVSVLWGEGYSYVISQSGEAVIDTVNESGFEDFQNIYRSLETASHKNKKVVEELREGLTSGEPGYIKFHNKVDKYMYYAPLGVHDWYVLNVVPAGVMNSTKDFIMMITYILCVVLAVIFFSLLIYIIRMERQKKKELTDILYVDNVTGGYSYARFCSEAFIKLHNTEKNAAFIAMDIDKFKVINELFGYEEGNKTLCYIWRVFSRCSQRDEIFARRIGDRFVALWFFDSREELLERIEGYRAELQAGMGMYTADYNLKITMGVYIVGNKDENVQNMINYAGMAQATVKGREDKWYAFYDDNFKEKLLQNKLLEDQMKKALRHKEFVVYYQPKYSAMTKELVGAEALVRWKKADGSIVMPGKFIPLAETNGFIVHLDKYIFAEVCKKQKEWMMKGKRPVPVSVNLSRRHLYNDEFMEEYKRIVDEAEIPTEYVQLELTESAIFENQEALCQIIDKLHTMGFRILMDDFGTGYSSLMMLKSVPIDILKLDKSFVDDFNDPRGEKIITSVVRLAQALRIEVTAEGVETEDQYQFIRDLGCNMVQGFYFAKPMPEDEFEKLLDNRPCGTNMEFTTASMSYI